MSEPMRIAFWCGDEGRPFVRELAGALADDPGSHTVFILASPKTARSLAPSDNARLVITAPAEVLVGEPRGRALKLAGAWLAGRQRVERAERRLETSAARLREYLRGGQRSAARRAVQRLRERRRSNLLLAPLWVGLAALLFVAEWVVVALELLGQAGWRLVTFPMEPVARLADWMVSRKLTADTPGADPRLAALAALHCDVLVTTDPTGAGLLDQPALYPGAADVAVVAVVTEAATSSSEEFLRRCARVGEQLALCVSASPEADIEDLCWLFHIPRSKTRLLHSTNAESWLDLFRQAQRLALWQKHCLAPAATPWPTADRPPARPRGPLEAFLFLQTHYRGGVWETVKDLLKDLVDLAANDGRLRLTLGVHQDQTDVESIAGLPGLRVERFRLSPIRPLEMARLLGDDPPWNEGEWGQCFFAGAAEAAVRADAWLALVDRFSQPLVPLRPYGVFVYDMIQRRVPQSFSPLFFDGVPRGMRPTLRKADRVIVTSPQTRDDVIEEFDIDPSRVELIPVSCNPGRRFEGVAREPVKLPWERFLLNVTNIAPHKGGEALFRAYIRLREKLGPKAPGLVVCGYGTESFLPSRPPMVDTAEIRTVRRLVQEAGWREGEDYVALGMVSDGRLLDLFQRAEVVINAALYDNGTFSVVEAAYFGKKTVSAGYPASRYLCERYRVPARFFPPCDVGGFAEALEQALASPAMTPADVRRVHDYLSDPECSSRRYAERVYDVLLSLAEEGRSRRGAPSSPAATMTRRLAG